MKVWNQAQMLQMRTKSRWTRGYSLTELAIVLGVAGVIIGSIWALAGAMKNDVKQEKFSEMLSYVLGNVRGNYVGKASFESNNAAVMLPILKSINIFPSDTVTVNAIGVSTPFGSTGFGQSSLGVCGWAATGSTMCGTPSTGPFPLFAIEALVSSKDCIRAALINSNSATLPGLIAIYITTNKQVLPLTLSAVESATTGCNKQSPAYVDFVFRLTP